MVLYDQYCASDRDCPGSGFCCNMGTAAVCSQTPCVGLGAHLCVEDCDCAGTTCLLTPQGQTAPPFIKTCSMNAAKQN
jgi:hypothetical protein